MTYLTSIFGTPQQANMTIVETGKGAPAGYSAPGVLFVSSSAAGREPSQRLLANQITRQWYGNLVSPAGRNHIWIANGTAKYAEILYQEHVNGAQVMEGEIRDLYVDAMTVTDAPVLQAARYEDYSPEFFAVTGSKGAATLHMLRGVLGEEGFSKLIRAIPGEFANKQITTEDFRKVAEKIAGQNLQGFFIQWLESTGAPEFKTEYTVYRTPKGFRVRGKITQDLDTFRMPVDLRIETEGNPEEKRVEVVGPQTEFAVESFGKPKRIIVDPNSRVLRMSPQMRVSVAIRRGEQFAELGSKWFRLLYTATLAMAGCPDVQIKKAELSIGPMRFDTATDRSVQGSLRVARQDLEAWLYRVPNVMDMDPLKVSCWLNERPTTVYGKCLWPEKAMLEVVAAL